MLITRISYGFLIFIQNEQSASETVVCVCGCFVLLVMQTFEMLLL